MKKTLYKIMKGLVKIFTAFVILATVLVILALVYKFFLNRDIEKIDSFCSEMKPGLDVNQIPIIAKKYDVGLKRIQDPNSINNRSLGIEIKEQKNTWFFAVAAPMTIGEYACGVYHNYQVVLSSSSGG